MIHHPRTLVRGLAALATACALATGPSVAQDDAPDPVAEEQEPAEKPAPSPPPVQEDRLRFHADIEDWVALPAGLEFEAVSVIDPNDPFGSQIKGFDFGTDSSARYGLGVEFPGGHGEILGSWWATNTEGEMTESLPGNFVFGELKAFPEFAGFENDGLADGYHVAVATRLKELRIDYARAAFSSDRVSGRWFVGYRQVDHERSLDALYFAFEPLLPPLFPPFISPPRTGCGPNPNAPQCLDPLPDVVSVSSEFAGRGIEAGLRMRVPFARDRVWFEGGFALAALRGDVSTEYRAQNAFYVFTDELGNRTVLDGPYDQFDDVDPGTMPGPEDDIYFADFVTQETRSVGLNSTRRSASASVIEAELGLRWRFWKTFELFGGYRSTRYEDVGVDVELAAPTGLNRQTLTEESRSVYYEGFFFGLTLGF